MRLRYSAAVSIIAFGCTAAVAAGPNDAGTIAETTPRPPSQASSTKPTPQPVSPLYRLGPGDEIKVQQLNDEELDGKTARIDDAGYVNLPSIGRLQVGGLTVQQAEAALTTELKRLLVNPQPVISVTEYRSEPVSVLGAVNNPGVIQLQGRKTLVETLSSAGGLRPDAANEVQVTRRLTYGHLPLPGESTDPSGEYSIAKINLASLLKGDDPKNNITVLPQDIISVPRAESIYVTGDVKKPGGFPLTGNGGVTVLQAVSMAEGLGPQASAKNAKIFRLRQDSPSQQGVAPSSDRTEIPVNLQQILEGKSKDFVLNPQDILFIPDSMSKKAGVRAAEAAIQAATGIVIWGRF
jgi:polysaccharide biosynthesis/export protein